MGKNEENTGEAKPRTPKEKSREGLEEKYGKRFETNLHEDSLARLLEIASWLDGEDYSTLKKGRGNVYRKTLNDVINMVCIDYLYEPVSKEAKQLKKLYLEFHQLRETHSADDTIEMLRRKYPSPLSISRRHPRKTVRWSGASLALLTDYRSLILVMETLDGVQRPASPTTRRTGKARE